MRDYSLVRKILLVAGVVILLGLAVAGPVQLLGGFHVHALLENWGANLAIFRAINGHPWAPLDVLFTLCWYLGNGWVLVAVLLIVCACRPGQPSTTSHSRKRSRQINGRPQSSCIRVIFCRCCVMQNGR